MKFTELILYLRLSVDVDVRVMSRLRL